MLFIKAEVLQRFTGDLFKYNQEEIQSQLVQMHPYNFNKLPLLCGFRVSTFSEIQAQKIKLPFDYAWYVIEPHKSSNMKLNIALSCESRRLHKNLLFRPSFQMNPPNVSLEEVNDKYFNYNILTSNFVEECKVSACARWNSSSLKKNSANMFESVRCRNLRG